MALGSLKIRLPRLPISVQFTREGLIFVLLSLAIGAAAVNTGNNILYLIFSLMLGMIIVSGMLSRRMLLGLTADVEFPAHVFAGVRNVCYVSLANSKKRLPSIAIRFLIHHDSFAAISRYFFYIKPAGEASGFASLLFGKRGIYRLTEVQLHTRAPFSFFIKIRRFAADRSVKVYPRVYRLSEELVSRVSEGFISESPFRGESHQLLHLRDYSPPDSSKRIHWKASAKMEKLLSKEYQKEQGRDLFIYYDCYTSREEHQAAAEQAISLLASLAFFLADRGVVAEVLFADRSFKIGVRNTSILPLLDFLAEFRPEKPITAARTVRYKPGAAILVLRSRNMPSCINLQTASSRVLYIEEWAELLRESITEVA